MASNMVCFNSQLMAFDSMMVVFHCALSQQRGPSAALRYARERESTLSAEENQKQQVFVLEGGFVEARK
jgi:hypothetical protein